MVVVGGGVLVRMAVHFNPVDEDTGTHGQEMISNQCVETVVV